MNNITKVLDHYLIPHQADWREQPHLRRMWKGEVETSLSGQEDRSVIRPTPWRRLSFRIFPYNQVERYRCETRLREGKKAGKVAVPEWGKGVRIDANAAIGATSLTLSRTSHGFAVGDYLLVHSLEAASFDSWDLVLVQVVSGATLTIAPALVNAHPAGDYAWPLFYGKPLDDKFAMWNSARARFQVTVQFDGFNEYYFAEDDFESYAVGSAPGSMTGGEGWSGAWVTGTTV